MISRKLQYIVAALVVAILAMGFYLVHLKRKAESISAGPVTSIEAPVSGPAEQMTLYLASDEDYSLRPPPSHPRFPAIPANVAALRCIRSSHATCRTVPHIRSGLGLTCMMCIYSTRLRRW